MFVECLAGVNKMGQVGICTYWLIWLALHWCQDYVYSCYIILLNLVIVSWRPSYIICNPSTIAWISYGDLWELANTTIEPTTTNHLHRLFKVVIGNSVKTGVVAGSSTLLLQNNPQDTRLVHAVDDMDTGGVIVVVSRSSRAAHTSAVLTALCWL
jgi:hypothetical protein